MTLAEKLRQKKSSNGLPFKVDDETTIFINFPPLSKFQTAQDKAAIFARRELADIAEDMRKEKIDEEAWSEAMKNYEGDEEPKKPKNKYEQRFEQEKNNNFMFIIGPYMLFDEDGEPAASSKEDHETLRALIDGNPDLITAIGEKMKEFGAVMSAKADKKK